jgi:hypothetical protein
MNPLKHLNRLRTFLIVLILSSLFCIDTIGAARVMEKGQPAPYAGILLTVEKANEARLVYMDRDACRIMQSAEHKELQELRENSHFNKVLLFVGGALAGALTVYAVKAITH